MPDQIGIILGITFSDYISTDANALLADTTPPAHNNNHNCMENDPLIGTVECTYGGGCGGADVNVIIGTEFAIVTNVITSNLIM